MKRVCKSSEPTELSEYKQKFPNAEWESMRNDAEHRGDVAYSACRAKALQDQGEICAYCECRVDIALPHHCRVEHYHSKNDKATAHNWALDWNNMLAVCVGGSRSDRQLPANLSCDAFKDYLIQSKKIQTQCEGLILNPLQLRASPSLFDFDKATGKLIPNPIACSNCFIEGNKLFSVEDLVQNTIDVLNLNCDRLTEERLKILYQINKTKKEKREANIPAAQALPDIVKYYFRSRWYPYFTTIRCILGQAAEKHLQSIAYQG